MESFVQYLLNITSHLGYSGIIVLMAIESSFIPFPSEVVILPAAYLAAKGEMNVYLVVLFGVIGSLIGAIFNYYIALWLGKPLVYKLVDQKWARFFLLSRKGVEKAEKYFLKYGALSTFIGRLLPAIRQLISLPAGFVRMNLVSFLFYTILGSAFWVSVLAALGYFFGSQEDVLKKYYSQLSLGLIVIIVATILIIYFFRRFRSKTNTL